MKRSRVDQYLSSPFRVDWIVEIPQSAKDDLERAVAEKAVAALRAARFTRLAYDRDATETEVKVWIDSGVMPACVTVHYEARLRKHYFLLMDSTRNERLAAVVFERAPSVTGAEAAAESRLFYETLKGVLGAKPGEGMAVMDVLASIQTEYKAMPKRK